VLVPLVTLPNLIAVGFDQRSGRGAPSGYTTAAIMAVPETRKKCGRLAYPGHAVTISSAEYQELLQV
jgi:hypothetical protein